MHTDDNVIVNTGLDWTTVTTDKIAGMAAIVNKKLSYRLETGRQQRISL